ncbi:MAG: S8 family serine peptidase [Kiritimatiellaceae bacterium]|nr:S8 family serine peptidase [Kiritimatiellaceae bacterium]
MEIKQTRLSDILNGSVFPETGSGRVNVDQLSAKIVLERRVADIGNGEVRRLFLVNGGGSYPYHRIEELVRYDAAKDAYVVVRQTLIVADHFMVKLRPGCTQAELETLNASLGTRIISDTGFPDIFMIQLATPSLDGVPEMMSVYEKETNLVLRTYVDSIDFPSAIPNDTNWASQWDKQRIACPEAWDSGTGSTNIIIAIIDTGIDLDHPDLAAHLWRNPGEAGALATNGIDDDHNGYVDDWIGWDFGRGDGTVGSGDNNPDDNGDADYDGRFSVSGHGTHCAGIAGAIGNNSNQVAGVCWNVAIMALKPFEYFPSYTNMLVISTKAVLAMKYAADKGAKVTSNSYGGPGSGSSYYEGIDYQNGKGVLFVAAAGNDTANNDVTAYQPAGVNLPNVIAVANSTSSEVLSGTSSYGATTVDIVAPGSLILSTVSGGGIATKSGTSMAAPQVAGAIALLYSAKPGLNYLDCKQALMDGVDKFPAYSGKCVSGGRLNVSRSLDLLYPIRKYPYSESFETGYGRWSYNTGSTPWITNSGPTPLPGTGPSAAADGTYYLYVQGGNASKTAILKTTFDFQALVNPEISWSYHMYGANIGQLYLEVSTNGVSWANPRLLFGNQGDQWFRTNVSLLAYAGMTNVQIRFRYFFSEFFGQEAETALDLISVAEGAVSNDSDNDGLPNDWETQYFGGATNANPNATASNGVNTVLQCYIAGLNPTNAASFFKATGLEKDGAGNGFVVRWSAVSGRVYSVYSVSNLLNSFQGLETNIAFPQSSYTDSVYRAGQFYKIDVRLAQ